MGVIIRTRAEGEQRVDLERDVKFLTRLWSSIQRRAKRTPAPALVHEDLSLVFEIIRDVLSEEVARFVVDDAEVYRKVVDLVDQIVPKFGKCVELFEGPGHLFGQHDLDKQIERALRRRVWLPRGGHINIDPTEALTAIDVNSGKFTGAGSLTDTVLQTNLQAIDEIVSQVRVRDIGGIIVIDFIDMDNADHRRQVMAKLKEALKADRVRSRVVHLTPLGLVEMTRKRTGDTLNVQLQSTCPTCEGRGRITSVETTAIQIEERLKELAAKGNATDLRVTSSAPVCLQLIGEAGSEISALEEDLGRKIHVRVSAGMHPERFVISSGVPEGVTGEGVPFESGAVVTIEPSEALDIPSDGLMAILNGCVCHVPDAPHNIDESLQVRLTEVGRSFIRGTVAARKARRRRRRRKSSAKPDAGPAEG
jgi:ribonuclease G